jgi:AcrR family transcriptional regulator
MLDAAEELLDREGPDALTVEAVVRESQASIGSFYARFGDRQGLLVAMQERFHHRLDERGAQTMLAATAADSLGEAIEILVEGFRDAFDTLRPSFNANLLHNRFEASSIRWLITVHFADRVTHPDPKLAADFVFRVLSSVSIQRALFEDEKGTRRVSASTWTQEVTRMLVNYLQPL